MPELEGTTRSLLAFCDFRQEDRARVKRGVWARWVSGEGEREALDSTTVFTFNIREGGFFFFDKACYKLLSVLATKHREQVPVSTYEVSSGEKATDTRPPA